MSDADERKKVDPLIASTIYPDAAAVFQTAVKPLNDVKNTCLVVVDTNVLLVPFTLAPKSLGDIANTYEKLVSEGRLVVPAQVAREFAKNRATKLSELYQQLADKRSKLLRPDIGKYPLLDQLQSYQTALQLESELAGQIKRYSEALDAVLDEIRGWSWNDPVSSLYRRLFTGSVVFEPQIDREAVERDLKRRTDASIPPGYKDSGKPDGGVGDLLIWHAILEVGMEREADVLFVSGEEKADWWHRGAGRELYPRFELVDEYFRRSEGRSFHIVSFSRFLEMFGADAQVVTEVRQEERARIDVSDRVDPQLKGILDSLPHDLKMVFLLYEIEGFTYKTIAEILDVPVGTVGWRLYRARRAIEAAVSSAAPVVSAVPSAPTLPRVEF